MWSKPVYVINLQTLKSVLKKAQKCAILTFKMKKFPGKGTALSPEETVHCVPSIRPSLVNTSGSATVVIGD